MRYLRISAMVAIAGLSFHAARAEPAMEYQLATGDVIEITAIGVPDIRSRATVDVDGRALFPLIGPINAAGLTISAIQANVREVLPTKVFRRRSDDGREYPIVLTPDEILVSIVEYRPVYVNGDVAKPGLQQYRPGLTVRQAIASAGGFDVMRFRSRDPFLESSDFKGEYDTLWIEFAREQARERSLRKLLGEKDASAAKFERVPVPQSVVDEINRVEAERLAASTSDYQKEKAHLTTALQKEEQRINVLVAERDKEKQDADGDATEFEATKANLQRGVVPTTRVTEARRLALYSATRALQTSALIAQLDSQRHEFESRLDRLDDQRRVRLLEELQNCSVKLAGILARLRAVGEKLSYAGMVRSQLVRGGGDRPMVSIFRRNRPESTDVGADSDSILMPGDVVEVAARTVGQEQN